MRGGDADKVIVNLVKSKMPCHMNMFLKNSENKNQLINLMFKHVVENRSIFIAPLQTSKIVVSRENGYFIITQSSSTVVRRSQKEADTKAALHIIIFLNDNPEKKLSPFTIC